MAGWIETCQKRIFDDVEAGEPFFGAKKIQVRGIKSLRELRGIELWNNEGELQGRFVP